MKGDFDKIDGCINQGGYTEHNPHFGDDLVELRASLSKSTTSGSMPINYEKCHRLLAEGDFVLSVCEGYADHIPFSFFDLYRLKAEKIVEHWDTIEAIPAKDEWKNSNGKF